MNRVFPAFGLLIIAMFAWQGCGGKEKPPLTPDGPEAEVADAGPGPSTMPAPDPHNK
ncbi:hypothetical protein [Pendulispora albinea]|uniref:Lipoprotein n=1 Tax=Pendulispora albinea TaxID=2741071 RepID=A0ABZ2LNE0_9BACT